MARTRKYNRVIKYAKQKWNPVIRDGDIVLTGVSDEQTINLVVNNFDTLTPTPSVLKVAHISYQVDCHCSNSDGAVLNYGGTMGCGILFVPEGITLSSREQVKGLFTAHPEWVMMYDLIDSTNTSANVLRRTSPLTRNLNSGDRLVFFVYSNVQPGANRFVFSYKINYVVRAN